ncbi:cytochrome-c peroxidase [Magnetococcales bacterium HHB-1]
MNMSLFFLLLLFSTQVMGQENPMFADHESIRNPLQALPQQLQLNTQKVKLGHTLFHDPRLSKDNSLSCASCHNLEQGGMDLAATSTGIDNQVGSINAPTVLNSGFNFKQFWDGRAANLFEQAAGPIQSPKEMGSNWTQVITKLNQDAVMVEAFQTLYKDGLTAANIQDAIAEFERALITPSPFDDHLRGDDKALTNRQKQGLRLFLAYGCSSCHQGVNLGGNMFQNMGLYGNYFADRGKKISKADLGRYNVTGRLRDRHRFKVPGLRNVALTPPYFHDGSVKSLDEAIRIMVHYQLGREIIKPEIDLIIDFFKALTGQLDGAIQ